tara:strand:+ start:1766 stop:2368 length:603 start_codon:yes stop_codon:yes gene_type:complete
MRLSNKDTESLQDSEDLLKSDDLVIFAQIRDLYYKGPSPIFWEIDEWLVPILCKHLNAKWKVVFDLVPESVNSYHANLHSLESSIKEGPFYEGYFAIPVKDAVELQKTVLELKEEGLKMWGSFFKIISRGIPKRRKNKHHYHMYRRQCRAIIEDITKVLSLYVHLEREKTERGIVQRLARYIRTTNTEADFIPHTAVDVV